MVVFPPILAIYLVSIILTLDTDKTYTQYLVLAPLAYSLGSIPWGYMIVKISQGKDLRELGSGRTGTSNTLRAAGPRVALMVLMLDVSKGVIAILMAKAIADTPMAEVVTSMLVLIGHVWPLFLGFHGGRGIGPGAGSVIMIAPIPLCIGLIVFVLVTGTTKLLSLGSLLSLAVMSVLILAQTIISDLSSIYLIFIGIGTGLVFWQHRDNIGRLLKGTERRLGRSAGPIAGAKQAP
ncbi:glycerol-3-phosphate 1-O-acyltransferase PlsY [SAR202 cluster bacterium AD-804-J14_MRT_500m]|nr:glycerol-3-phosphate 1-O-acyltransferase PlsY [SAR202 cluster bacterium AD-804-J14_MRT_500m]